MPRCRWHLGVLKHLTAYSCRAKTLVFQHTSILVRPRTTRDNRGSDGGAAGYCPRVRCIYFTTPFIAIDGPKPDIPDIDPCGGEFNVLRQQNPGSISSALKQGLRRLEPQAPNPRHWCLDTVIRPSRRKSFEWGLRPRPPEALPCCIHPAAIDSSEPRESRDSGRAPRR